MLVSVIIPSYNHEKYILDAVTSVLNQSYPYFELIIVDDGSKDSSVELIKSCDDSRIFLVQQENSGAHAAINRGLDLAQGDYLTILNSDDAYYPERLRRCISYLDGSNKNLVCSWIDIIDKTGNILGTKKGWENMLPKWAAAGKENGFWQKDNFLLNILISNFTSTTSNIFFTRTLYERVGGMKNLRFAHDWDFVLRACKDFQCGVISESLLQYRIHGSNTITSNEKWMMFEVCWVLANNIGNFEQFLYDNNNLEGLSINVEELLNSFNFQGNDRLFWTLRQFIEVNKRRGLDTDSLLLDAIELRSKFMDIIK